MGRPWASMSASHPAGGFKRTPACTLPIALRHSCHEMTGLEICRLDVDACGVAGAHTQAERPRRPSAPFREPLRFAISRRRERTPNVRGTRGKMCGDCSFPRF